MSIKIILNIHLEANIMDNKRPYHPSNGMLETLQLAHKWELLLHLQNQKQTKDQKNSNSTPNKQKTQKHKNTRRMTRKKLKQDDFSLSTKLVKTSQVTWTFSLVAFTHVAQNV